MTGKMKSNKSRAMATAFVLATIMAGMPSASTAGSTVYGGRGDLVLRASADAEGSDRTATVVTGAWCASPGTLVGVRSWSLAIDGRTRSVVSSVPGRPSETVCSGQLPRGVYDVILSVEGRASATAEVSVRRPLPRIEELDSPTLARHHHAAALLPDGRALVVGGATDDSAAAPTEVIDPDGATVDDAAAPAVQRSNFSLVTTSAGRVLAFGSFPSQTTVVESFDPTTGTWSPAGSLLAPLSFPVVAPLGDGRVLVGGSEYFSFHTSAEVFDPGTGLSLPTGRVPILLFGASATTLDDGRVLVAGTENGHAALYDPTTNAWSLTAPTHRVRQWGASARLLDGRVIMTGGFWRGSRWNDAEIFDPATGRWLLTAPMDPDPQKLTLGPSDHTATTLPSGEVLILGARSSGGAGLLYDPLLDRWGEVADAGKRSEHATVLTDNGDLVVVGGTTPSFHDAKTVVYRSGAPAAP